MGVKGKSFFRQAWTKSDAGYREILPKVPQIRDCLMKAGSKGTPYLSGASFNGLSTLFGTHSFHEDSFIDATARRKATFKHLPSPWKIIDGKLVKTFPR